MKKKFISLSLCLFILLVVTAHSGEKSSILELTETLFSIPSPTGYESPILTAIQETLSSGFPVKRDNLGSLYWRGGNQPSSLAVCVPVDETGYFVSGINQEGYLRLDKGVFGSSLIDSYHLGHPMIVWTKNGPVEGVLALPSLHILTSEVRRELQENPGLHLAFLDIGVDSKSAARDRGIGMLDAVTPWKEITPLAGGRLAGHELGIKCCTALVLNQAINLSTSRADNPTFVWMAQTKFPVRRSRPRSALGALRASKELKARDIIVVDVIPCDGEGQINPDVGGGPVLVCSGDKMTGIEEKIQGLSRDLGIPLQLAPDYTSSVLNPFAGADLKVIGLLLPSKFAQTPSEIVDTRDLEALDALLHALLKEGRL
jgi:putative aminopeptidase FrvX